MKDSSPSFWRTPNGIAALALIAGVLYFLLTEHRAHFFGALPYLILLLCPVMHIFMHRGHGGHGSSNKDAEHSEDR